VGPVWKVLELVVVIIHNYMSFEGGESLSKGLVNQKPRLQRTKTSYFLFFFREILLMRIWTGRTPNPYAEEAIILN
jgi:hypothetical protein